MRRLLGTVAVMLLLAAAPAHAQEDYGPVVATAGSAKLHSRDSNSGQFCLAIEYPKGIAAGCTDTIGLRHASLATAPGVAGGAVVPEVKRAEIEWTDGARTAVDAAESAAYKGKLTGKVRFFLATHPGAQPWLFRYYDAGGTLIAAAEEGNGPRIGAVRTLATGKVARLGTWKATAFIGRTLAPGPGIPDRTETIPCVRLQARSAISVACADGEPLLRPPVSGDVRDIGDHSEGAPQRHVVLMILGPGATGIDAYLGDGRRVRLPVRVLAGAAGEMVRVVGWPVPKGSALRRIIVRDGAGKEIDQQAYLLAPATVPSSGSAITISPVPVPGTPETAAGPVSGEDGRLTVREAGEARICAEVDQTAEPACGFTPLEAGDSLLAAGLTPRDVVVGGIVSPDVASVRLEEGELIGATPATVTVQTQAPSPYAGRFAAHVRAFVGILPNGGQVTVHLLAADGTQLAETPVFGFGAAFDRPPSPTHTRLKAGGVSLRAATDDPDCVFFADDAAGVVQRTCSFGANTDEEAAVLVACRPATALVLVPAKGRPGMTVATARGKRVGGRTLRLGKRAFRVFAVRAPDAPRTVTWRGGRLRLGPVPPPARQCGYAIRRELGRR